jgi:hypothetical protein
VTFPEGLFESPKKMLLYCTVSSERLSSLLNRILALSWRTLLYNQDEEELFGKIFYPT